VKLQLTAEQRAVFDYIESTRDHVFITGRAGTGKSTLLNHLSWNTEKQVVICAPTGVAALNVGGQTIHSLFRLPIGLIADTDIQLNAEVRKLLNTIDTVVIDEVSMVNADVVDAVDRVLRKARGRQFDAFGGVQIVMFGDPYQLPPVPGDADERAYYRDNYRSMWFFDAKVWLESDLHIIELATIHRQKDPEFAAMLTAVRHGRVTADVANVLNTAGARTSPEGVITLATRNDTVARINKAALERLPGRIKTARAEVSGEFGGRTFPADEALELKPGAHVMFLRNDADQRWVNGTIGVVTTIRDTVWVEVDGEEFEVQPSVWEKIKYSYKADTKELKKETVGEFQQFPLRLAWAVTIHKSQGCTYDQAILDLGDRVFSAGQTYVALSRLTNLGGLYMSRPLRPRDIIVDDDVRRFMSESPRIVATALPAAPSSDSAGSDDR
jgi:ATP-dependent exoDNAse (exonuclease V) alpha subunit